MTSKAKAQRLLVQKFICNPILVVELDTLYKTYVRNFSKKKKKEIKFLVLYCFPVHLKIVSSKIFNTHLILYI